jgi:hypothetical protein
MPKRCRQRRQREDQRGRNRPLQTLAPDLPHDHRVPIGHTDDAEATSSPRLTARPPLASAPDPTAVERHRRANRRPTCEVTSTPCTRSHAPRPTPAATAPAPERRRPQRAARRHAMNSSKISQLERRRSQDRRSLPSPCESGPSPSPRVAPACVPPLVRSARRTPWPAPPPTTPATTATTLSDIAERNLLQHTLLSAHVRLLRRQRPRASVTPDSTQMGHELTHPDPPDPRSDVTFASPPPRSVPHGEERVLDRVRDQCIVEAARPQSRHQPRHMPVVQTAQRLDIFRGDGTNQRSVVGDHRWRSRVSCGATARFVVPMAHLAACPVEASAGPAPNTEAGREFSHPTACQSHSRRSQAPAAGLSRVANGPNPSARSLPSCG